MRQHALKRHDGRIKSIAVVLLLAISAVALIAYLAIWHGESTPLIYFPVPTAQPVPTSVHIMRIPGNLPGFHIVPLDRTITDSAQVTMLYDRVITLPPAQFGGCAAAPTPEGYLLTFYRSGQSTLIARIGFCPGASLDRGNPTDTITFEERFTTPAFWFELSRVLGIPQSQLEPYLPLRT